MTRSALATAYTQAQSNPRSRKPSDESTLNPASFSSTTANLPVGGNSSATAVADFNKDGIQDLVVTLASSAVSNNVAVFLGSGNGSFGSAIQLESKGLNALSVVTGDFNSDGNADIVTANAGSNTVSLLLGNGNGSFQAAQTFQVGNQPNALATGDFNKDGSLDLVTANAESGANSLSLLLNNGKGGFGSATKLAVAGTLPFAVATGDLNGDGNLDLVSADSVSGSVSVFLGKGNGEFKDPKQYAVGGATPVAIITGNFDDDNDLDIATGNLNGNSRDISILYGNGDGEFLNGKVLSAGGGVNSLVKGDFNGDGNLDLAGAVDNSATLSVLFGDGKGEFTRSGSGSTNTLPARLSVADLDQNGKLDLVAASGGSSNVAVLSNQTSFVILRSTKNSGEVDGSQETEDSINANLKTGKLTINSSPVAQVTISNFKNVQGTQVKDTLTGNDSRNSLSGNNGQDKLLGLGGNDIISGGAGRDRLEGGKGDDRLTGGIGGDQLKGDEGRDQFIFDNGAVFNLADGQDRIADFDQGRDKLVLDRGTFTALGKQASFESVQTEAAAKTSEALITYVRSTGRLYYNADGAISGFGTGGLFATLDQSKSVGNLTASDFLTRP